MFAAQVVRRSEMKSDALTVVREYNPAVGGHQKWCRTTKQQRHNSTGLKNDMINGSEAREWSLSIVC
jgi:hypothetical protein